MGSLFFFFFFFFLLCEVIVESGASDGEGATVRAHSIRGIATSSAFFKNWSSLVF